MTILRDSSPHCQPQSVMGGVEGEAGRAIFRPTEKQKKNKINTKELIKDYAVNCWYHCSNVLTICPSDFITLVHLFLLVFVILSPYLQVKVDS